MIKRFLQKVFSKKTKAALAINKADTGSDISAAKIITAKNHKIDKNLISQAALKTCDGLQKTGFEAFIVGGAVRDLLMNVKPKDFDIATNATPEEVYKVFRRSRIIGKRFRLVHVLWGQETIEVSTFRGHHLTEGDAKTNDSGRIIRDNIFGSLEDDAVRRDFTANALYYNPANEEVLDFHNGVADLNNNLLRMIGDPTTHVAILMSAFFIRQPITPPHRPVAVHSNRFCYVAFGVVLIAFRIDGVGGLSHFPRQILFDIAALNQLGLLARRCLYFETGLAERCPQGQ